MRARKLLLVTAALVLGLVGALLSRGWVVDRTLGLVGLAARSWGGLSWAPVESPEEPVAGAAGSGNPIEEEEVARSAAAGRGRRSARPVPRNGVVIGEAEVLAWADAKTIPRARLRAASGVLPAGLEIEGAGAFVAAMDPGDRLIAIDGAAVRAREDALRMVIEARSRGQKTISATFVRRTVRGAETFQVLVVQPY